MDGIGSKMSPEERYFRSLYLMYQVCTEVLRHYFDDKNPPDRLVQYLLDKRLEFEKEERKIPNYQWIQLYPEALFRADVNITEKYIDPCNKKDYKEFAHRMKTIFTYIFDTVDGEQEVKLVKTSRSGPGEVLTTIEISSHYNPDGSKIKEALEQLVNGGKLDASLEISSSPGFSWHKQGDKYTMDIILTKKYDAALGQKDSQEFKMMAKGIERILLFLYDSVPGTQSFQVEEFRSLPSTNCISAICNLKSVDLKNEKKLKDPIERQISEGRLGNALTTTCSQNGFSFKDVIVFESEIKVDEQFSKNLANSDHPDFKALVDRVQPIIKGLYASSIGEQDVEIVRCRRDDKPDTMFVVFHLISHGNDDEEELRKVIRRGIRTGSLSLSYGITADGFKFESNKCMFNVKVKLAKKYPGYKDLANPTSDAFKSFKEKVQPEILRLYDQIHGVQEIDIDKYKIESSGADHFIIFKLTSSGCSDESTLKETLETQIQTGLLGSSLTVTTSGLSFLKLVDKVFYQVSLNVKRPFTDGLKKKHGGEFNDFSKFVQSVLNTNIPGNQEVNVVECQQGPSGTISTEVILEIISQDCTDEVMVLQPIKDLIAVGKLELTLKTSATDFTFKSVRGSKPVSSMNFDLSLLITLLRKDSNVEPPKTGGYDDLPSKDDKTDGAQIATIKHYRNDLAHASEAKKNEHEFDSLWSNLENAVRILGKADKFMKAVDDASTMKLDSSTEEVLIRMVQQDRQILQLEEDVTELYQIIEKLTKQTEDQSASTQVEISEIKEKIGKKEEQILQIKTDMQTIHTELHRLEKKYDEKFKVQDERNVQQDEKNKDMGSGIQGNTREIQENRRDIQENRRDIQKRIDSDTKSQKEGLENTAKQLDECKRETNKIGEIQTQHLERVENLEKETESLKLNEEVRGKEIKDLQENQQGFHPKIVKRREIDKISLPESFEKIKEVNKGSDALRDNDIVILVGIKGSGKSTIGKAIIKQFCEGNPNYDIIQLSTTMESYINYCDGLGFFRFSNKVVFLDDLFGTVPSTYAFKEHLMLLKWVYEKQDGIKILCTVQAETKACVEELFASDHGDTLLISAEIINLHSAIYPRRDMLIKSGIDEKHSDNIIRQIKETGVQERIGFPALLSIYKENQELGDELFINPGNVFMKYLSSLKEGSDHDKMYFVILIHVLMTGKVFEENQFSKTQNTSDKESMCHIATTIFGNTLEFQKCDSSIERIIDEKEDSILMNKDDPPHPYYCFKDEITPNFIFQYYKAEGIEKILTTCSLNCIVRYFRPFTVTDDEPLVCIDLSLYRRVASHIVSIIKEDLKTPRVADVITSAKTLCMSPLLQDENFIHALMTACDQLSIHIYAKPVNVKLGYDKWGTLNIFHLPSMLLHQCCRQLSMMYRENVKVVKTILLKLCHTVEKEDSLTVEEKQKGSAVKEKEDSLAGDEYGVKSLNGEEKENCSAGEEKGVESLTDEEQEKCSAGKEKGVESLTGEKKGVESLTGEEQEKCSAGKEKGVESLTGEEQENCSAGEEKEKCSAGEEKGLESLTGEEKVKKMAGEETGVESLTVEEQGKCSAREETGVESLNGEEKGVESLTEVEKEAICQTVNTLVKFSMEELCKENIDEKEVLEMLWNFIMDKEVDCQDHYLLMNAWRNQCTQTVIWLQENVKTPNCLQMEQCFLYIFEFLGEHKANWFLEQIPKSKQNKINMYNVFNKALERRRYSLMENIWKWEKMILEDYRHDKQLNPNKNHADVKKNFANMFMNDVLKEPNVRNEPFMWAFNTFKPHANYFDNTMIKKINRNEKNKHRVIDIS